MSTTNKNEPIILAVARNGSDITLRIDNNGWAFSEFAGTPVVELKLMGCRDAAWVWDEVANSVDQSLYYEILKEADAFTVRLWINYHVDEIEVTCAQIDEVGSDYTVDELKGKASRLAQLYLVSAEANRLSRYIYHLLRHKLSQMISKEMDLYQRKIDSFSRTNPEEAATLRGEAQAYQKVLTLIGLGEVDGKPIATQIEAWVSRIWNEHLMDQAGHSKSSKNRITDLGEAALFPLLEMLKNPDPELEDRKMAIYFLGLIVPAVKEMIVVNILGSDH
jgi:hypothetical protein